MQLAIFDMAGTTIDDRDEVYRVLREATERAGARFSDAEFQRWMGTEKRHAIANLLRIGGIDASDELVEQQWQWFRAELRRTYTSRPPTVLPGVEAALWRLRDAGLAVGLTSGFSREIMDLILSGIGWTPGLSSSPITAATAGDEVPAGRPEPYLIRSVMSSCSITDASRVVSSGDTAADVQSAKNAGVTAIGVLTGHLSAAEFEAEGADAVLASAADLPEWLGL